MKTKLSTFIILIILAVLAGFVSCKTPSEKLATLLKKHPSLVKKDTIFKKDTIYINDNSTDTLFMQSSSKDTVFVNNGRLLMKYFYSNDTVFLSGKCKDSVIIREIPVTINDVKPENAKSRELPWYFWPALFFMATLIFYIVINRRK